MDNHIGKIRQESFEQGRDQVIETLYAGRETAEKMARERGRYDLITVIMKKGYSVEYVSKLTDIPLQTIQEFSEMLKRYEESEKERKKQIKENPLSLRETIMMSRLAEPQEEKTTFPVIFLMLLPLMVIFLMIKKW